MGTGLSVTAHSVLMVPWYWCQAALTLEDGQVWVKLSLIPALDLPAWASRPGACLDPTYLHLPRACVPSISQILQSRKSWLRTKLALLLTPHTVYPIHYLHMGSSHSQDIQVLELKGQESTPFLDYICLLCHSFPEARNTKCLAGWMGWRPRNKKKYGKQKTHVKILFHSTGD